MVSNDGGPMSRDVEVELEFIEWSVLGYMLLRFINREKEDNPKLVRELEKIYHKIDAQVWERVAE